MKNISYQFIIVLAFISSIYPLKSSGQWVDVSPKAETSIHLFDVDFLTEEIGFAVGQDIVSKTGYIFRTTDGGKNWSQTAFPNAHLRSIDHADENNLVVTGHDGPPGTLTIWIKTSNQGEKWQMSTDTTLKGMNMLQFVSSTTGFAVGYGATFGPGLGIMKTTDGGTTWTPHASSSLAVVAYSCQFMNANEGYIAIADITNGIDGKILRTNDGGKTLQAIYGGSDWMHDISFHPGKGIYALEGIVPSLRSTIDGGATWSTHLVDEKVTKMEFLNHEEGYVFGDGGYIAKTRDGGQSWSDQSTKSAGIIEGASVVGEYIYICSSNGEVYRTKHGITSGTKRHLTQDPEITLFPSSATTNSVLKVNGRLEGKTFFTLRDISGKVMFTSKVEANQVSLSEARLTTGIYLYHIENNKQQVSGKILLR